ncbi:hypothetical protein STENM36S_06164 [Streptomyces tendae]
MRQLRHEGWMHNRGRLLVASFLTKTLYVDWRVGARHFLELLVDGDVANNQLNWQWAAGTGTDTRPHRVLNPLTQARRFDPDGAYVRRWVPELSGSAGRSVHEPWRLPEAERSVCGAYPDPIVGLSEGLENASPLASYVALVDTANGIAVRQSPREWMFPNVDLTLHLHRAPRGRWTGLDTTVVFGPTGQGVTSTVLHDLDGPVGHAQQLLTVRPQP